MTLMLSLQVRDGVEGIVPLMAPDIAVAYAGGGFECIIPSVSGEYDLEYVLRSDVARRNVKSVAASLAHLIIEDLN